MNAVDLHHKATLARREILSLAQSSGNHHIAPAFSIVEILVVLYNQILRETDKFILSKGHGCLGLYVMLRKKGYHPAITGHPDIDPSQGIECTTGSLGHGLPLAVGMALSYKLRRRQGDIYVLISDGECQEGTTWESALLASHHQLDNLTIIIDDNKIQSIGRIKDVLSLGSLREKFEAFGFHTIEVDGHSPPALADAFTRKTSGKPQVIIAHTIKGKGVSYMEDRPEWHNRIPDEQQMQQAWEELR